MNDVILRIIDDMFETMYLEEAIIGFGAT
ncbi:MAG: hypothetical protein ACR5K4_03450 [Sodalis sp. (in: enterobacteria)]